MKTPQASRSPGALVDHPNNTHDVRPCPFCGSEVVDIMHRQIPNKRHEAKGKPSHKIEDKYSIHCKDSQCGANLGAGTLEKLISRWNRRGGEESPSTDGAIQVERLSEGAHLPERQNPLDAAFDLHACFGSEESMPNSNGVLIPVGASVLIPTGLKVALPPKAELQVRPRSGLSIDHGIDVANSPGTVDPGYRGHVKVILENRGDEPYMVEEGDRIAQAAIRPVLRPSFEEVETVPEDTNRGEGGFNSTGT